MTTRTHGTDRDMLAMSAYLRRPREAFKPSSVLPERAGDRRQGLAPATDNEAGVARRPWKVGGHNTTEPAAVARLRRRTSVITHCDYEERASRSAPGALSPAPAILNSRGISGPGDVRGRGQWRSPTGESPTSISARRSPRHRRTVARLRQRLSDEDKFSLSPRRWRHHAGTAGTQFRQDAQQWRATEPAARPIDLRRSLGLTASTGRVQA